MKQLSMFEPMNFESNNKEPLPLRAARHFGFPLQHHGEMYALQDWVAGLTGSSGTLLRKEIGRAKSTVTEMGTVEKMPYVVANGKTYKVPFVDNHALWRVVAFLYQTSDRPILKELKNFLADAGVFIEEVSKDVEKAARRLEEIADRKSLCAAEQKSHETHTPNYGMLTNQTYQALFGAAKSELCKHLGLNYTQARNFREQLSELARRAIQMAEAGAAAQMNATSGLSDMQQGEIVRWYAAKLAPVAVEMAQQAGIDLLSGKRMIEA